MDRRDRQRSGPEQAAGSHAPHHVSRPAPGKVTRTSKLSSSAGPAVQRKAAATTPGGASAPARSSWELTMDPWMDAAHRGATALVQAKADAGVDRDASVPAVTGSGQAMPAAVQAKMEQAFGADFSAVRVHQGSQAESLGARAFTQGTDVHFQPGLYQPDSRQGQELLGHELAHVVQQSQGRVQATVQARGVAINDQDSLEREADTMGAAAARGERVSGAGPASPATSGQENSIQRKPLSGNTNIVQMDGGFWDTMRRGAGIYLGITLKDEGSAYAKALMRHYVLGGGGELNPQNSSINFPTDAMWSSFMAGRPEIQRGLEPELRNQAATLAGGSSTSGHVTTSITGVRLNERESMRWTLHGCHRVEIELDYSVTDDGSGNKTVTFTNMHFRWIDVGDMHPGTVTETDSGEEVDDADLMGAGSSFPINIPFAAPGSSVWSVSGGTASQSSGWPNAATATSTRHRGS
jgi:Domain of unknown function (DUF4157)